MVELLPARRPAVGGDRPGLVDPAPDAQMLLAEMEDTARADQPDGAIGGEGKADLGVPGVRVREGGGLG
jgi:hypothetical protein